jgi:HK97 family phage prohead protease
METTEKTTERTKFRTLQRESEIAVHRRQDGESVGTTLRGYAAVFDSLSEDMWGSREVIAPGAFTETLAKRDDVIANVNHSGGLLTLGRNIADPPTLMMREDDHGLYVEITPPDTQAGRDAITLVERGDINKMSFAFYILDESREVRDGVPVYIVERVQLVDVSLVNFPAYTDTEIEAKRQHYRALEERVDKTAKDRRKYELEIERWDADIRGRHIGV